MTVIIVQSTGASGTAETATVVHKNIRVETYLRLNDTTYIYVVYIEGYELAIG